MKLAGTAFMDAQSGANFTQTEFAGVAHAHHGAISRGQAGDFFTEDRSALVLRQQVMRRKLRWPGNGAFEIRPIFGSRTLHREVYAGPVGVSAYGIQHLSSNAKLRISGKGCSAFWGERPGRLQKTQVPGLNQIRHFYPRITWKRGEHSGRQYPHQPAHILFRFRR
jgi:hypothetical protein